MNLKIKFYSDPGHGWAAVKRKLLDELAITDKITYFSYQRGATVYLEEDCDLSTLITAVKARGDTIEFVEKSSNKYSSIRSYDHFSPHKNG
jgi:hypothetical protein